MKNFRLFVLGCISLQAAAFCQDREKLNERLFSITPDEMVFASKLSDENRRLFCYKFSINERQIALQRWEEMQDVNDIEAESASSTPDDAVEDVFDDFSFSEDNVVNGS